MSTSYGVTKAKMTQTLQQLTGSFIVRRTERDKEFWAFWHPTFDDVISATLSKRPDLFDVWPFCLQRRRRVTAYSPSLRFNVHSKPYGTVAHFSNHRWQKDARDASRQFTTLQVVYFGQITVLMRLASASATV